MSNNTSNIILLENLRENTTEPRQGCKHSLNVKPSNSLFGVSVCRKLLFYENVFIFYALYLLTAYISNLEKNL